MHNSKAPLLIDGAAVAAYLPTTCITLTRVRSNAYRVEVASLGPLGAGGVVDELSRSWPTEAQARTAARGLFRAFWGGATVAQVIGELVAITNEMLRPLFGGGHAQRRDQHAISELTTLREQLYPASVRAERRRRLDEMAEFLASSEPSLRPAAVKGPMRTFADSADQQPALFAEPVTDLPSGGQSHRPRNFAELKAQYARDLARV